MRSGISALCSVGLTGCAAAEAPAPMPATVPMPAAVEAPAAATPGPRFDGTYVFVSLTKVHATYAQKGTNWIRPCPDTKPESLIIVNDQARYSDSHGREFEGTVGSQGELGMRWSAPNKYDVPSGVTTNGRIGGDGAVTARLMTFNCSYDLIWQKSK